MCNLACDSISIEFIVRTYSGRRGATPGMELRRHHEVEAVPSVKWGSAALLAFRRREKAARDHTRRRDGLFKTTQPDERRSVRSSGVLGRLCNAQLWNCIPKRQLCMTPASGLSTRVDGDLVGFILIDSLIRAGGGAWVVQGALDGDNSGQARITTGTYLTHAAAHNISQSLCARFSPFRLWRSRRPRGWPRRSDRKPDPKRPRPSGSK